MLKRPQGAGTGTGDKQDGTRTGDKQDEETEELKGELALADNKLRNLALALTAYEDDKGRLPAHAIYSKDGKALLSWRVALLPYLTFEDLYNEFKLDEPWDSAHNKKLLERMPALYSSPSRNPKRTCPF